MVQFKKRIDLCLLALLFVLPLAMKAQVKSSTGQSFDLHQYDKASIQFLMLQAKQVNGEVQLTLVNSVVRSGRLKKDMDVSIHHHSSAAGWVCTLLDAKGKVILEKHLPHPLVESVEYVGEESNALQRKEVRLDKQDFVIRLPYNVDYASLRFEQTSEDHTNNTRTPIATIKIN